MIPRRIRFLRAGSALCLAATLFAILALGAPTPALAHPPAGKSGPTKAEPLLKKAQEAKKRGDVAAYRAALAEAKKIMAAEERYSCCIKGGCDECAMEKGCPCGADLFEGKGVCQECLKGIHAGQGRYEVQDAALLKLASEHEGMRGLLGPWPMNREGSGTSWIPESSPMYGRMRTLGGWQAMEMASVFGAYTDAGGKRGESQFYAASQYMLMAQKRDAKDRVVALRGMLSLDPLTNGAKGYPNLFQTGETANGQPLRDRQHPHDFFMELAASVSVPVGGGNRAFVYVAPVGEPALGPAAYPHRPSAWDYPTAPISHHWLDASHITFGVATAGLTLADRWKVEGSVFTGREPDEDRYGIDRIRMDSYSGRLTHSPGKDLTFQASYAFLKSPEPLEPEHNAHRLTVSAQHNRVLGNGANLASMVAFGRNLKAHGDTDAFLVETTYTRGRDSFFARYDDTQKDEMVDVPEGRHRIQKLTVGASRSVRRDERGEHAVGAALDFHRFPSVLKPQYGSAPVSVNLFYRWRFGRM